MAKRKRTDALLETIAVLLAMNLYRGKRREPSELLRCMQATNHLLDLIEDRGLLGLGGKPTAIDRRFLNGWLATEKLGWNARGRSRSPSEREMRSWLKYFADQAKKKSSG